MSIQDRLHHRPDFARWLGATVGQAIRWGLIAFAVMAALRVAWRLTASSKPVRTVEQAVAGAGAGVRP